MRQPDLRYHCRRVALADTPAAQTQDPSASGRLHLLCRLHAMVKPITLIQLNQAVSVCLQCSGDAQQS